MLHDVNILVYALKPLGFAKQKILVSLTKSCSFLVSFNSTEEIYKYSK